MKNSCNFVTLELFWGGVILTPKRSLKNIFFRSKNPPRFGVDIEE